MKKSLAMLTFLAAAPAYAQPGSEPVQTPTSAVTTTAPQNEDWSNVSHINGQVIPVGEHGNYVYKWKKTNISSNPVGWLTGFYGVSVSHAVHDNVAVRVDANLIKIPNSNVSGYEFGASAPIYFKRVFQGPFLEPGVILRDIQDNGNDGLSASGMSSGSKPSIGPSVVVGYHWTFDSGLNLAAAIGIMRNVDADDDGIEPSGYFRVGYAF